MSEIDVMKALLPQAGNPIDITSRVSKPLSLSVGMISLAAGIALLYYGQIFVVTLSTAVIINFILEPFVGLLIRVHVPRPLASFSVCFVAVCAIYLAGLGVYKQGTRLAEDLPRYAERIGDLSDGVLTKLEDMEHAAHSMVTRSHSSHKPPVKTASTSEPIMPVAPAPGVQEVHIQPERPPLLEFIHSHLGSLYQTFIMASFVPFLVYFMLSWRDHIRPALLQLFEGPDRIAAATSLDGIASMVRAFVFGNFLLGLLLAAASTAVFWWFGLPYPMLIGSLSGFLSLVPSLGVPLAVAPPLVAALGVYRAPAPYLILVAVVALFHLLAINLLYPKIVGRRVHLNPVVVAIAMMFWGVLWGAAGLILAIPLTAGIKAVCEHVKTLERYARLLGD